MLRRHAFLPVLSLMVSLVHAQTCECWMTPDASYTTIDNATEWIAGGFPNNDDGSYGPIELPFSFHLYGSTYSSIYINTNGNLSFDGPNPTYSASGFPVLDLTIIAPFWTDVDLAGTDCLDCNQVAYKVTNSALYVTWTRVGYYQQHTDTPNSFQVIITDGNDPVVADRNNVSFCYGSMQWTTGDASSGEDGFGGSGASIGANLGDGALYFQAGRFDHAGDDWDGPLGQYDGVNWLTGRHIAFNTMNEQIPPVITTTDCDTITLFEGETAELVVDAMPTTSIGQVAMTSSCPTLSGYTEAVNTIGDFAHIEASVTAHPGDAGVHEVTFDALGGRTVLETIKHLYINVLLSTGVSEQALTAPAIVPNPALDQATVTWPAGRTPQRIEVLALDGQLVRTPISTLASGGTIIDLTGLAPGTYMLRTQASGVVTTTRLVKMAR